jgi:pyruvate dehydrogenase E2 component (dihydrolipoamide acetyltransferase)
MESGVITKWHKSEGDKVEVGDVLFEVATDKATVEYHALDGGYLRKIILQNGVEAVVNQTVAVFSDKMDEDITGYQPPGMIPVAPRSQPAQPEHDVPPPPKAPLRQQRVQPLFTPEPPLEEMPLRKAARLIQGRVRASPLARKLARERGIDLTTIKGTGPHQRIVAQDIEAGQPDRIVAFGREAEPAVKPGAYEMLPMTPMRKTIGQRLQDAKGFIPHFYVIQEVNCDPLHQIREQLRNLDVKVTFNDMIVRAAGLALRQHPNINTGYDSEQQAIIRFQSVDICIAVSVDGGLITPIIRYADFKNLGELSVEIRSLNARARAGKLERHEYMGGSFTISNLGMYGVQGFSAIINPPQAAILAVGGILEKPTVRAGQLVVGKVLNLTLSADHRVIDGACGAEFLNTLKNLLENPAGLLIS